MSYIPQLEEVNIFRQKGRNSDHYFDRPREAEYRLWRASRELETLGEMSSVDSESLLSATDFASFELDCDRYDLTAMLEE